jgi:hypothetical protein
MLLKPLQIAFKKTITDFECLQWVKTTKIGKLAAGSHQLSVRLLEPTMVITKIVLDLGGVKSSTLGPPESFIQI